METRHHTDGGGFEEAVGYSRAVRRGGRIEVSGTTVPGSGACDGDETKRQTLDALSRAVAAVEALGGERADVVRTRLLLAPGAVWEAAGGAHRETLGDVAPANTTLYVAGLIGEGVLVEVEVEAEAAGHAGGAG